MQSAVASCLDGRARALAKEARESYVEIGLICVEVENRELWQFAQNDEGRNYTTFSEWMTDVWGESRATAYEAKSAIKACKDIVPEMDLRATKRCNLKSMGKLSTAVIKDPEIQEAARTKSKREFVKTVRDKYPGQHIEEENPFPLSFNEDQEQDVLAACADYRALNDTPLASIAECIHGICWDFSQENRDRAEQAKAMAQAAGMVQ